MFHNVYLILGANKGDVTPNFHRAIWLIEGRVGKLIKVSGLYQTDPWGMDSTDPFYNQVLCVSSRLQPLRIMDLLLGIELEMGRSRTVGVVGPREIDIDILFIDEMIISEPGLEVPHPRMHLRRFALQPLADIAPELRHPIFEMTISDLLNKCDDPLHATLVSENLQ